jgi:cysteine desulfurase/selenocysteine lyase
MSARNTSNNAGASLSPKPVLDALKRHIDLESIMGGYEAAEHAKDALAGFYDVAAQLIGCAASEIAFSENATRAWDMAFYSLQLNEGDRIVTSKSEYASNYLAFLQRAKQRGVVIDVVPDDAYGQMDTDALRKSMHPRTKLIAITHVPTQGGLINPAVEVGKVAKEHEVLYLLDTTQSLGQIPIDVRTIGCDFLCATGRKYLRGPRGTGFLYVNEKVIDPCAPPFIDLHSATWQADNKYLLKDNATRFETWEQNIAAKLGLKAAIEYALELGLPAIWQRIQTLATNLRHALSDIPGIILQDLGLHKCGIVTFSCNKINLQALQQYLSAQHMNVSISLQEYAPLDLASRGITALIRASVHYYNTDVEISKFAAAIVTFLKKT